MSGKNNVNPGQYKVAGRERPQEAVVHEVHKQQLGEELARERRESHRQPNPPRKRDRNTSEDGETREAEGGDR